MLYTEPDSDWLTNENSLDLRFYYKVQPHLIDERYKKLAKTINTVLLNAVATKNTSSLISFCLNIEPFLSRLHLPQC